MLPVLQFDHIAPQKPFHAVLVELQNEILPTHQHDFWEIAFHLSGEGVHHVNGIDYSSTSGSLLLIRPHDRHTLSTREKWQFINVAFPADDFNTWCKIAGLAREVEVWNAAKEPSRGLKGYSQPATEATFRRMAALFGASQSNEKLHLQAAPRLGLERSRFWNEVVPLLLEERHAEDAPPWFLRALEQMQKEENLHGGYKRLCELCHVAPAHLSRVCRGLTGQTPSQWVSEARLQKAASLLLSTSRTIDEIGEQCGFENKAYFYRLFVRRFNVPPRAFRLRAQRVISR